jgi:hypothetical protein
MNFCFCQQDEFGLNFVQKTLNRNSSNQKVEIFMEILEYVKFDKIDSKIISNNFQENFEKSNPKNSLFFDALKVGNVEAFNLIVEFVGRFENSSRIFSEFLKCYFEEFVDKFDVLDILLESLSLESVRNILNFENSLLLHSSKKHQENYLKFLKFSIDHFSDDFEFIEKNVFAHIEVGENFSLYFLNLISTENQMKNFMDSIRKLQQFLGFQTFGRLLLNSNKLSFAQILLKLEVTEKIEFLDILGLDLIKELFIRDNQKVSQILDRNLVENYFGTVLNYFDGKLSSGIKISSLEQLKFVAIRQISIEYNFDNFVKPHKESKNVNQVLLDLEILKETTDGFKFVSDRNAEIFGFPRYYEILHETNGFTTFFTPF